MVVFFSLWTIPFFFFLARLLRCLKLYISLPRLKLNHGNFRVEVPEYDVSNPLPSIPKELIDRKAYLIWESRGRTQSSPEQQKVCYGAKR